MEQRTIDIIKICKGRFDKNIVNKSNITKIRLWMTEYTGVDWFENNYWDSMYSMVSGAFRDYFNETEPQKRMALWQLFESYKNNTSYKYFYKKTTEEIEEFYIIMIDSICSTLGLIEVYDSKCKCYINGFKEEDFKEDIKISEETMEIYQNYLKNKEDIK